MVSPLQLGPQLDLEHLLSEVVEVAPYGVALTMTDGHIVLTNAQLERMFGYGRAARILDMMQREGIIGPPDGSRPREVLKRPDWLVEIESQLR